MQTITTAAHAAHLDVITGTGYLVGGDPLGWDADGWGLLDADLHAMLSTLEAHGWRLDGEELAWTPDGRAVRLLCAEPVNDPFAAGVPDFDALAAVDADFLAETGIDAKALDFA